MPYAFSQELRERLVGYFLKYHGLVISTEQADEFLDSMGDFCLWIESISRQGKAIDLDEPAAREAVAGAA
jgi:hypothetical protein